MIDLTKINEIILYTGKTDLRASIFGLTAKIQESFSLETIRNKLFVFCSKNKRNIKIIELDYDGFWLYQKINSLQLYLFPRERISVLTLIHQVTN